MPYGRPTLAKVRGRRHCQGLTMDNLTNSQQLTGLTMDNLTNSKQLEISECVLLSPRTQLYCVCVWGAVSEQTMTPPLQICADHCVTDERSIRSADGSPLYMLQVTGK